MRTAAPTRAQLPRDPGKGWRGRDSATSPRDGKVKSEMKKPTHGLSEAPAARSRVQPVPRAVLIPPPPPFPSPGGDTEPWLLPHYSLTPRSRTSGRDKVLPHPFEPRGCRFPPRAGAAGPQSPPAVFPPLFVAPGDGKSQRGADRWDTTGTAWLWCWKSAGL